jgi:hypothetical protein
MDNLTLQIKIQQRLNKLGSQDYDNIQCWQIVEAFNKVQLEWVRRQLHGNNASKEGDEHSSMRIDDLQPILRQISLKGGPRVKYFETGALPTDFMKFKRVSATAVTECCPERPVVVYEAEEHNADILISDSNTKPSFEWAETFCTRIGNRVRIYTNGEFSIIKPRLTYYRKPIPITIQGCYAVDGNMTKDTLCEFKDDVVEILIDECVSLLAGDIDNFQQMQRNSQNAEKNN